MAGFWIGILVFVAIMLVLTALGAAMTGPRGRQLRRDREDTPLWGPDGE